jgi:hypothetical protein
VFCVPPAKRDDPLGTTLYRAISAEQLSANSAHFKCSGFSVDHKGVDKTEYVRLARAIPTQHRPKMGMWILLPGGGKRYLRRFSDSLNAVLDETRKLIPPPEDAFDLQLHYVRPMADLASFVQSQVDHATRLLSFRKAVSVFEEGPRPGAADIDYCEEYGLSDSKRQASFAERAAQVGIDLSSSTFRPAPLTAGQMRRVRRGGPKALTLISVSVLLGGIGFILSLRSGLGGATATGVAFCLLMGGVFWAVLRRAGRGVLRATNELALPLRAVGVTSRIGNNWRVAIVSERDSNEAISSLLTWRVPRSSRGRAFLAGVIGDPSPEGRFALVTEDGQILVAARKARLTSWPPIGSSQKMGRTKGR